MDHSRGFGDGGPACRQGGHDKDEHGRQPCRVRRKQPQPALGEMDTAKILVATSCDTQRALLTYFLQKEQIPTQEAGSIEECASAARDTDLAVAVVDPQLWRAGARPAALFSDPAVPAPPFVILGDPTDDRAVQCALQHGASDWIARSGLDLPSFLDRLRQLISQPRPAVHTASESQFPANPEKLTLRAVSDVLHRTSYLPAFSFNVTEIITTVCKKNKAVDQTAYTVQRDPMLALALLQAANQPEFIEAWQPTLNVRQALEVLGVREFYKIAEAIPPLELANEDMSELSFLWLRSVATARLARFLTRRLGLCHPDDAATAGLLANMGSFLLALRFKNHYRYLRESAVSPCATLDPGWQVECIGVGLGDVASLAFEHFDVPVPLRDAIRTALDEAANHGPVSNSSRILGMVVAAALRLTDALFPGDPPLLELRTLSYDMETALLRSDLGEEYLLDEVRAVVMDLVAEMLYLFRESPCQSAFYTTKPLEVVTYHAPCRSSFDLVRAYFQARTRRLHVVGDDQVLPDCAGPAVLNLSGITSLGPKLDQLDRARHRGLLIKPRGLVLVDGFVEPELLEAAPRHWRVVPLPCRPAAWMPWFSQGAAPRGAQAPMRLVRSA